MKPPTLRIAAWLACIFAILLASCAQFGLQAPQTTEDRIQYGKTGVGAAYRALGDAVATKQVTGAKAAVYFGRIEEVEQGIATADSLLKNGKPTDALAALNLALAALTAIRNELPKGAP